VLFGDSDPQELEQIATATGGKVFDARTAPLADVFKEIRGYQ
jgi:Ca-activated chloride channel homolog